MIEKLNFLVGELEDAIDQYCECLDEVCGQAWQDKYGDDSWDEFHELYKKVKIKAYVEE